MRSGFWGMSVEQGEQHADRMEGAAGRLEELAGGLRTATGAVHWAGPDAEAFRQDTLAALDRLAGWTGRCHDVAAHLQQDVAEQEQASSAEPDGALFDPFMHLARAAATGIAAGQGIGSGSVPSPISAIGPLLGGLLGEYDDPDDDIAPITIDAISRPEGGDLIPPDSVAALVENLRSVSIGQSDDATSIRVQAVIGADGGSRYVVYVPGSFGDPANTLNPADINANPLDWNQNPGAFLGADTDSRQAVEAAMQAAGIPSGAEVVLAGHSQGGIVAGNLAADPAFNGGADGYMVTDVLTVGSPVEQISFPDGTRSLNLAHLGNGGLWAPFHPGDPVASLDGNPGMRYPQQGDGDGHQEVYLPATEEGDLFVNHGIDAYTSSVASASGQDGATIQGFESSASMQGVTGGTLRDTVDVAVSRVEGTYRTQAEHDELVEQILLSGRASGPYLP